MDGATIQAKVYRGYAISAKKIGLPYAQYRPAAADLTGWTPIATLPATFNAEDMTYSKPNKYAKPTWFVLIDGTQTQVGDYLIGPGGTFFIAAQQALLPILAVECNRTVTVSRPGQTVDVGLQAYGGDIDATEDALMTGWPASILQGTKGEKEGLLPGDTRTPWWSILLPAWPGVVLRSSDVMVDDLARRYIISSAELTDLGWRITATQGLT